MHRTLSASRFVIQPKNLASKPKDMMLAWVKDVSTVCEAAIEHECSLCLKSAKEAESCPLRLAMQRMATPYDVPDSGCEYAQYSHECG